MCVVCYFDSIVHQHTKTKRLTGCRDEVLLFDGSCWTCMFNAGNNFIERVLLTAEKVSAGTVP